MGSNRVHDYTAVANPGANESAANTETVAITLAQVMSELGNQSVKLHGWIEFTPGAAATAVTLRIRRDGLTGALVQAADVHAGDIVAAKLSALTIDVVDQRGGEFSGPYVLTVQGTGEGGAGTTGQCELSATVS